MGGIRTDGNPAGSVFSSGVASGDVTDDSVVLWTRVDPGRHDVTRPELTWSIGRDGATERRGVERVEPDRDHCVHVLVDGLRAGTRYDVVLECAGESITARTRTLPTVGDRVRFAVVCCSRWGWPGFEQFDRVLDDDPTFVLHLGDSIYEMGETTPSGGTTDPPHDCHTLDDYRRRHRQYRRDRGLQRLLAAVPMMAVWDDHEVADNAPDPGDSERRLAGQRAWSEWMPTRWVDDHEPLDRQVSVAGLVDLAIVDSRFRGRSPSDVGGPGVADDAPGRILAPQQWRTLADFAERSRSPWFVLANQVQVSPMTLAARPALSWPPWKRVVNPDQWDGYPDDRAHLASILRRVDGSPVVLSGDLHSAWSRTWRDGASPVAHEFTCPSISGETYARAVQRKLPLPVRVTDAWLRLLNRGIDHLDLDAHGYLLCDVTPTTFTTTFVTVDGRRHEVALSHDEP